MFSLNPPRQYRKLPSWQCSAVCHLNCVCCKNTARMSKLLRPAVSVSRQCYPVRAASSRCLDVWHHGPDSLSMPAVNPEAVTLVNMRFCPYAQRTALCLNAKNVEYDVINSQLMTKPRWLWEINPIGKVPVLIHDGNTIYESLVTCEYIEVCKT